MNDRFSAHNRIIGMPILIVNRHADKILWHVAPMNSLGDRLRKVRKLRRLTQKQLAKNSGVKQPSISELETGETKTISGDTLISLSRALGVRPAWLERESGPMEEDLSQEQLEVVGYWGKLNSELKRSMAISLREMATQADRQAILPPVSDAQFSRAAPDRRHSSYGLDVQPQGSAKHAPQRKQRKSGRK